MVHIVKDISRVKSWVKMFVNLQEEFICQTISITEKMEAGEHLMR